MLYLLQPTGASAIGSSENAQSGTLRVRRQARLMYRISPVPVESKHRVKAAAPRGASCNSKDFETETRRFMDAIICQTLATLGQRRNELTNSTNTVRPQQNVNQVDKVSDVLFRLRQERSGEHRQLNHENAAQELVVRWNVCCVGLTSS